MCAPLTLHSPKLQTNAIPFGCGINNGGQTEVPRLETGTLPLVHCTQGAAPPSQQGGMGAGRRREDAAAPPHLSVSAWRCCPCLPLGKFLLLRSWPFHRPIWASHVIMRSRASPYAPLSSHVQCQCVTRPGGFGRCQ